MDHGPERGADVLGVEAGRDAQVRDRDPEPRTGARSSQAPGVGLEGQGRGELARERVLRRGREVAEERRGVELGVRRHDRLEQRDGAVAQALEHGAQLGGLHPRLEVVEQRVVGVLELEALHVAALELDDALEVGEEGGEVGVLAGRLPRVLGERRLARDRGAELGRNPASLLPVAAGHAHEAGLERVVFGVAEARRPRRRSGGRARRTPGCGAGARSGSRSARRASGRRVAASASARPMPATPGPARDRRSRRAAREAPGSRRSSPGPYPGGEERNCGPTNREGCDGGDDPARSGRSRRAAHGADRGFGRPRPLPDLSPADADHLARDRGLHRRRCLGPGEPAPAAHEARIRGRDRLRRPGHDPDRPRGAHHPLARRSDREPRRERAAVRAGRHGLRQQQQHPQRPQRQVRLHRRNCRASPTTSRARSATPRACSRTSASGSSTRSSPRSRS